MKTPRISGASGWRCPRPPAIFSLYVSHVRIWWMLTYINIYTYIRLALSEAAGDIILLEETLSYLREVLCAI